MSDLFQAKPDLPIIGRSRREKDKPYRVIQWSTGNVGKAAIQGIIEHPDLELVGLVVHSLDKAGRDAGELCGLGPVGVTATTDIEAALALDADAVSYTASGELRPMEAIDDMERCLRSGKNVVSTSVVLLYYPPAADKSLMDRLEKACIDGGVSCFSSGIDPGFSSDLLPLTISGFCSRVDSIRVQEIFNYNTYNQPETIVDIMGFSQPMDSMPMLLMPGAVSLAWYPMIQMIADGLGVTLDRTEESLERCPAPERIETASVTIEKGTIAGLWWQVKGIVGGEERIIMEHVTRMRDDIAPEWPQPSGNGDYRIIVKGNPNYTIDMEIVGEDGKHTTGGVVSTAMRVINAIPAVVDAPPGMLSTPDFPLITGHMSSNRR
jgi:4-hydroxy-tetrahydrodipicolinate reductase